MKRRNTLIITAIILVGIIGIIFSLSQSKEENSNTNSSVGTIDHGHGMAVDVADPSKVYIATHRGLLVLMNDQDLYRVGAVQDDLMGFSPHPTDPKIYFSSGHPKRGGNLGFQKSVDGGLTWDKVSNGVDGPVDFHAMAVSSANSKIIYGWYNGALQRSTDEGKTWEIVNKALSNTINLITHPTDEAIVYAATDQGLLVSKDQGFTWTAVTEELQGGPVVAFAINPINAQEMLSFSQQLGLAKSSDAGATWQKMGENFDNDVPLYFTYTRQKPEIMYALTRNNVVYKSLDGGSTWSKIR